MDRDRRAWAVRPRGRGRRALRRRAPAGAVDGARVVVVGRRGRPLRGGRHRCRRDRRVLRSSGRDRRAPGRPRVDVSSGGPGRLGGDRDPPVAGVDFDDLRRRWAARAAGLGFERSLLVDRGGPSRPPGNDGPGQAARAMDEYRFAAALGWPDRSAARRDVVGAWAGGLAAGATVADVERCVDALVGPDDAIGVAERRQGTAGLVPTSGVLRALGPRPGRPEQLAEWQRAATDIDRYRARWAVADPTAGARGRRRRHRAVGAAGRPAGRPPGGARRVAETRRRLGRPPLGRTVFARDGAGPDRALGR